MIRHFMRKCIALALAVLTLTTLAAPSLAAPADNTQRMLYYSRVLGDFLAGGRQNTAVIFRDIDGDGEDELVTYRQFDLKIPAGEIAPDIGYRLDVYDMQNFRELHFSDEKTGYVPYEHDNIIFLSDKGYLAFYTHASDISQQPGWVYDNSKKHAIKGGLYTDNWVDEAKFDDKVITPDEFIALSEHYGLPTVDQNIDELRIISYGSGTSIINYSNTQADISRLLAITSPTATPTGTTFMLGDSEVALPAYMIENNNYVKLRDVAALLGGRFDVRWEDGKAKLYDNAAYTAVGGELAAIGTQSVASRLSDTAFVWGETGAPVTGLVAYNIGDNNYIKLRDIAQLFDFDVDWRDGKAWLEPDVSPYTPD